MNNPTAQTNTTTENASKQSPLEHSRLQKNLQKRSLKNILLAIGGTLAVILLLIAFGSQLLIYLSTSVGKSSNEKAATNETSDVSYIAPPIINPMQPATNSATITISGSADSKQIVKLYINDKFTDKTETKNDKTFTFKNLTLEKGENNIKAKTVIDEKESGYSSAITITYTNKEPILELESPQDGQSFRKDQSPIKVTGKTDQGVKVTVNDFWAIVDDQGTFSYQFPLKDGDNAIKIVATNDAGNKTTKEIKIKTE